jgi:hypothetical protein
MTSEDTLTVVIPLEEVEQIKLVNIEATAGASLLLWIAVLTGLGALILSNMEFKMNFSN